MPVRHLGIILVTGLILRILYDSHLPDNMFYGNYILDSLVLHSWALDIINGDTADLAFFRAPLYPYVVATLYKMFGVSPWSVIIFQHLLGLFTGIVAYLFARRLFGQKVALWTGLITVAYPTLIYFEGEIMITSLAVFLYTLAAYRLYRAVQTPSRNSLILGGLVFGLAAITRPTILPLAVILPIVYLLQYGKSDIKAGVLQTAIFALAILVPILPVTMINAVKGGEPVLISTQGGANFYIGNNQEADGITVVAPGPNLRIGKYNDNIWTSSVDEAEFRAGRNLSQSEVSSFWFSETLDEMTSDIPHAATLLLKKFYYFWHGQEIFNNKSLYYAGEYSWLMNILLWKWGFNFPSGLLIPLALVGMFLAWRNNKETLAPILFILLFSVVIALFFVCARFRQPIVPMAVMFATFSVRQSIFLYRENRKLLFSTAGVFLVLVLVLNRGGNIESKQNLSQFEATIGNAYLQQNSNRQAALHLEQALEYSPENIAVYDMLGQAYLKDRRIDDAERVYLKGLELFPVYPYFNFGLGQVAQMKNDQESAKDFFRQVLHNAPEFAPAADRLGHIFYQERRIDSALHYYQVLNDLRPGDPRLEARIRELEAELDGED